MQNKGSHKHKFLKVLVIIFSVLLIICTIGAVLISTFIQKRFETEVPAELFRSSALNLPPKFYQYSFEDRVNRIGTKSLVNNLGYEQTEDTYVSIGTLPEDVYNAFIAIEDKRFYSHNGVDWPRTLSAGFNYLFGKSRNFGGSTITQQLVKNVTGNSELSIRRKIQEMLYARDLERLLDKEEILERYLNVIAFSDGCNGITEAARHYFSKKPSELSVSEAASIAAITNNPTYYNPIKHPENNLRRRNLILSEMQTQGYLSEQEYEAAIAKPLGLCVSPTTKEGIRSWYLDMVIEDVITDLAKTYDIGRAAASRKVHGEGLQIEIAMDATVQELVEEYYRTSISMPENAKGDSAQSALIVIDSHTGDILGIAGAVGKKTANRVQNFATQTLRSPGSALKPITVYAPALEKGIITWSSVYDDVPIDFGPLDNTPWPKNASYGYRGLTNIAYAVAHSTNTVAVRVLDDVGIDNSYRMAKNKFHLGLVDQKGRSDKGAAALALGQLNYGVSLRELTAAYTVFADAGCYHPYRSYYRVLDADGNVLLSCPDRSDVVMSAGNAAIMTKLLEGVVERGTSSAITLDKLTECAGKTGTTQNDCDRWFIGYTPELICGVWCGFEYPEPLPGSNTCLGIWNQVMHRLFYAKGGKTTFDVPKDVVKVSFCKDSGKLLTDTCALDPRGNRSESGWFVLGTEPKERCTTHVLCDVDRVDGGVVHANTVPSEDRTKVALIQVERNFPKQIIVTDAQYVYRNNPILITENSDLSGAYFEGVINSFCGRSAIKRPFNRSAVPRVPIPEEPPQQNADPPQENVNPPGNIPFFPRIW